MTDQETLYHQNITLKKQLNVLQKDYLKQKTKVVQLEQEVAQQRNELAAQWEEQNSSVLGPSPLAKTNQDRSLLIKSMKQTIKEQKALLEQKDNELLQMKQDVKFSSVKELQNENHVLTEQVKCYVHKLKEQHSQITKSQQKDQQIRQFEEKLYDFVTQNEQLRLDNINLARLVQSLHKEHSILQQQSTSQKNGKDRQIAALTKDNKNQKQKIQRMHRNTTLPLARPASPLALKNQSLDCRHSPLIESALQDAEKPLSTVKKAEEEEYQGDYEPDSLGDLSYGAYSQENAVFEEEEGDDGSWQEAGYI